MGLVRPTVWFMGLCARLCDAHYVLYTSETLF